MKLKMILSVISIAVSACGDNENVLVPEPKPIRKPIINLSAPVINQFVVPDQVHAGARVKLEASAEDPDGNLLTYNWEAPGKIIRSSGTGEAVWTVPIDMGVVTVALTVKDGIHEAAQSADIEVIHPLIVPGKEMAGIRLIDRLDKITHLYGEPSRRFEVDVDKKLDWIRDWDTRLDWDNAGLTVYFRQNRIYEIAIGTPNPSKTTGGKGIGSTCDEAKDDLTQITGYPNIGGKYVLAPGTVIGAVSPAGRGNYPIQNYGWDFGGIQIGCVLGTVVEYSIYKKAKKPLAILP